MGMGLVSKIVALGIAKKVYDEARKPENQRRAKEATPPSRPSGPGSTSHTLNTQRGPGGDRRGLVLSTVSRG